AVSDQVEALGQGGVSDRDLARADERLDALEGQARHVAFLVGCRNPRDLGDAFVTLTLAVRHGAGVDAVATLARMYVNLGRRHHGGVEVLADRREEPQEDVVVLLVSGAGAYALLAGEAGLHQVSRREGEPRDSRRSGDRDVVRVEVLPVPYEEGGPGREPVEV